MNPCWICGLVLASTDEHHVVPRASGGSDGPTVDLCATCHSTIHNAATKMRSGRAPDAVLSHLPEEARKRALGLAQVIVAAAIHGTPESHLVLSVVLDQPSYMRALDRWKADRGFTSRDRAINAILRGIATHYGLVEQQSGASSPSKTRLSTLRRGLDTGSQSK